MAEQDLEPSVLAEQWFSLLHTLHGELTSAYREGNQTLEDIAQHLNQSPERVDECLRGRREVSMRTMHDLARAMGYRLKVKLEKVP